MRGTSARLRVSGTATVPVLVLLLVCLTVSAGVFVVQHASHADTNRQLEVERAFQMAEAGAAYALSLIRENNGALPATLQETRTPHETGSFTIRIAAGNTNGRDDDGDGTIDEADEEGFRILTSVGRSGDVQRAVELTLRQHTDLPPFEAGLAMNSEFPIVDLDGGAFRVNGDDHELDGSVDFGKPSQHALTTAGDPTYVEAQIASMHDDQITGAGSDPSVGHQDAVDLDTLLALAAGFHDIELPTGTTSQLEAGTPTEEGVVTVYCAGDLTLSGGATGAGLLAVDGDLHVSGGLDWTGIVLVRGSVVFTGGGGNTRLNGSMIIGEDVSIGGTVDLWYSSDAVAVARLRLIYVDVLAWRQVAAP